MFIRSAFIILLLLSTLKGNATHIVGGDMYYVHLGGNSYRVTIDLYRDCGPANTNGTEFDDEISIGVFGSNGLMIDQINASHTPETIIPVVLSSPCLSAPPDVCIATARYEVVLDLPPSPGGYDISFTRCCRSPAVQNLIDPNTQGLTCTVHIPGNPNAANSSPEFSAYPPLALCLGNDLYFDHSALDADGDSLAYGLVTPYQGGDAMDPQPIPFPPPYAPVNWAAGYSATNPIDGAPPLTIDPITGEIHVFPTVQGEFVVGVMVQEFRNGVLLGEVRRDFKFVVVECEENIIADIESQIDSQQGLCSGLTHTFNNLSINGQLWAWDFGDPSTTADVSDLMNPSWTYADTGVYTITLIVNPGLTCADTATTTYEAYLQVDAFFDVPTTLCIGDEIELEAEGYTSSLADIDWLFEGTNTPTSSGVLVASTYPQEGAWSVSLTIAEHGCNASYTDSVYVYPFPEVGFTSDASACIGEEFSFYNTSTGATSLYYAWDLGDGTTATDRDISHLYEQAGTYTVGLTISTDSGCVAERTLILPAQVEVYPNPVAAFSALPPTVSLIDPAITVKDFSGGAIAWSYSIEDKTIFDPDFDYMLEGAGDRIIIQTVTSDHGCMDTTSVHVFVTDHLFFAPAAFTPNNDGKNDTFAPVVLGAREYEIVIYDRWGQELFRSTETHAEWSGEGLPQGVYTYTAHIAEYGSYSKDYSGCVTLLK